MGRRQARQCRRDSAEYLHGNYAFYRRVAVSQFDNRGIRHSARCSFKTASSQRLSIKHFTRAELLPFDDGVKRNRYIHTYVHGGPRKRDLVNVRDIYRRMKKTTRLLYPGRYRFSWSINYGKKIIYYAGNWFSMQL